MNKRTTNSLAIEDFQKDNNIAFGILYKKYFGYTRKFVLENKGNLEEMGKMPGQDEKDHKSTFVTILGADKAQHYAEEEAAKAKEALGRLSRPADVLAELVDLMVNRKK